MNVKSTGTSAFAILAVVGLMLTVSPTVAADNGGAGPDPGYARMNLAFCDADDGVQFALAAGGFLAAGGSTYCVEATFDTVQLNGGWAVEWTWISCPIGEPCSGGGGTTPIPSATLILNGKDRQDVPATSNGVCASVVYSKGIPHAASCL